MIAKPAVLRMDRAGDATDNDIMPALRGSIGIKHYFVDEAGDTTLFDKAGSVIIGSPGVSRAFVLGVADVVDPKKAGAALSELRASLLADPYFKGVPSMQPNSGKTSGCFHAKDDLPEVRREVFRLLAGFDVRVQAIFRRISSLIEEARKLHGTWSRLRPEDIYDGLVRRLFKNLLHRGESREVCFARRGRSDRQGALEGAIESAKAAFRRQWKTDIDRPVKIRSSVPSQDPGLQIVDYYIWALQRLLERGEDRYFNAVADRFSLVMDIDDKSLASYGRWYSSKDLLTRTKLKPLTS